MRNLLLLFTLLFIFNFLPAQDVTTREIKWERIHGWKNKNTKAYVDAKSLHKVKEDGKDFNIGMILFYSNESEEVTTQDKTIVANISASYFVADCETSRIAPVSDFYFNMDRLPDSADEPLLIHDYSYNVQPATEVDKTDPILTTLCPTYI